MAKMSVLKSWLVCLVFLMDYTMSMSSENSENNNNNNVTQTNGTYWQSIANCVNRHSKLLPYCVFRQSLRRLDDAISSNETWQLNDYVSLKKNEDWKPIVLQARAMRTPYGQLLSRVSDLLMSRSLQFTLPPHDDDGSEQREARYFGSSGSGGHGGGGGGHDMEMGRKKKKGGVKFGGVALIAMVAQLFMGKIAFLAGASLLISKLALIFSIFNALKKQTSSSSGGEHVVYEREPAHGGSWQRSIVPEMPEKWNPNLI